MNPSEEAIAWGKRQAARSPRWTDAKWRQVETIFEVVLTADAIDDHDQDQADDQPADENLRDVA
ncbi:hypothetical protein ACFQ07_33135 [Actinomadura adrarensis]|uniref:Transposase n=1 Tax=Actinomadura adrarensis TaxID=1819600 RepID=A0ABW3CRE1_9ACTN